MNIPHAFKINPISLESYKFYIKGELCEGTGKIRTSDYNPTYTGGQLLNKSDITVYDENDNLVSDSNYRILAVNWSEATADVSSAIIRGKGPYANSTVTINFHINKKSLNDSDIKADIGTAVYNEETHKWELPITVTNSSAVKKTLEKDVDYTVTLTGDTTAGDSGKEYTITGINNYTGEITGTYSAGTDISDKCTIEMLLPDGTKVDPDAQGKYSFAYIGENRPIITAYYEGQMTADDYDVLPSDADFDPSNYNAGKTVTVTIKAKGTKYYGSKDFTYTITKKSIEDTTAFPTSNITDGNASKDSDFTYTYDSREKSVTPNIKYTIAGVANPVTLTQGTDFTVNGEATATVGPNVAYDDTGNVTTIPVTIEGTGNYTGTRTVYYTINRYNMTGKEEGSDPEIILPTIAKQMYTGAEIRPEITKFNRKLKDSTTIEVLPSQGYTVSYDNNVNVTTDTSKAKVIISGKDRSNYEGTVSTTFEIGQEEITYDNTRISEIPVQTYDKNEKKPSITVFHNGQMDPDTDYDVFYYNNVIPGKGVVDQEYNTGTGPYVRIVFKGSYTGELLFPFTIKGDLNNSDYFHISGFNQGTYPIQGGTVVLDSYSVKVEDPNSSGSWIDCGTKDTDYTLILPSPLVPGANKNLRIMGISDIFEGSQNKAVTLTGDLSEATLSGSGKEDSWDFDGTAQTPEPTVTYNGQVLTKGTDYQYRYTDNKLAAQGQMDQNRIGEPYSSSRDQYRWLLLGYCIRNNRDIN